MLTIDNSQLHTYWDRVSYPSYLQLKEENTCVDRNGIKPPLYKRLSSPDPLRFTVRLILQ